VPESVATTNGHPTASREVLGATESDCVAGAPAAVGAFRGRLHGPVRVVERDALGDRTGETDHSATGGTDTTTAYTYNGNSTGQPHTLTSASTTGGSSSSSTFGYDPAGNMTARTTPASGAQTLTWNEAGQLASVAGSADGGHEKLPGDGHEGARWRS
jgi:YD repeat-containing protein